MHAYKGRDNRVIEQIGSFDPLPNYKNEKLVGISFDRFNYWYSHGNVILTRPVEKLMGMFLPPVVQLLSYFCGTIVEMFNSNLLIIVYAVYSPSL